MPHKFLLSGGTAILMVLAACSDNAGQEKAAQASKTDEAQPASPVVAAASNQAEGQPERPEDTAESANPDPSETQPEPAKEKASPPPAAALAAASTPAVSRPAAFARCVACHDAEKGSPDKLGPNLFGVAGNQAAVHSGYSYSDALKSSGLVWSDANLNAWLENPRALVPGNKMAFPGLKDAAKRQEIIDYLKAMK